MGGQKRPGRARERRRELLTTIMGTTQEKEKEGKRNGRGGTRVGTTRKNWEGRVHQSTLAREECEGVTRGATGGQRRARNKYRRTGNGGGATEGRGDRDRTDKRGKCVRWGRKRKIPVISPHHPARAGWSTACVAWTTGGRARDGQPSSPFKKKKEEGICNSSLIKIIFRPIIYWKNERGNNRVNPVIFSPFLWCCAYLPPFWAPTETRPRS